MNHNLGQLKQNCDMIRRYSQQPHPWLLLAKQNWRTLKTLKQVATSPFKTSLNGVRNKVFFFNLAHYLPSVPAEKHQRGKRPMSFLVATRVMPGWQKCGIHIALSSSGGQRLTLLFWASWGMKIPSYNLSYLTITILLISQNVSFHKCLPGALMLMW